MTIDEFDDTEWSAGMTGTYHGERMLIVSVDFEEKLIGLSVDGFSMFVRCENVSDVRNGDVDAAASRG